ncbi:MAG TPA: GH1 family beta-glucosidase [Candidatus Limnocylindria bacterium]|jgi:beta-glucosidase|nr:GH1 family beta-glucosidase [Candidatus Limnocylindria bacterium]
MTDLTPLARRFPARFLFGTATAAYQIEGAHDEDGKGLSIWDTFCRQPGAISTGETGDIACDHYHRWREDVALMRSLGCNAYRFSISWPRVMPDGTGKANEAGLAFYDRLVNELLANGIRPFVTLYHWDLPQALQDRGGWASRDVVGAFGAYAGLVAKRLGDRVRDWMTLNEPEVSAFAGHYLGVHAPGIRDFPTAVLASHHLLLAHRAGNEAIRAACPSARVGIALNLSPCEGATDSAEDAAAARRMDGYLNRWFLDPLFARGYPEDMVELYGPYFDRARELDRYDGALDFVGLNYYARRIVRASNEGPLRLDRVDPQGEHTAIGWEVHPPSLRALLVRVHRDYAPARMFVTENGAAYDDAVVDDRVDDPARVSFLSRHFSGAAAAIADGVPLESYFIWTLMDNFEWAHGTSKRFGIVHTDYRTQRRRIKSSGAWYRDLIAAHRATRAAAAAT